MRAFDIALRTGHPVYDCLYLALAESLGLMILTVDHKLILACGHTDFAGLLISLEDAARLPQ
ncbi:type II toxin-antitoxin system VapC family toxin [Sphingomonas sp. CV7422]|uniref:type II toxin-antitoxin system VapC family toxin n=1 Tax=Sphingomonas sp. CV7422 TaxID=3018036 RepID=UPI0022FDFD6E|nr:type II toxin-antitoxin system VapC family toxin [Sphingomonas sp. CV7422]